MRPSTRRLLALAVVATTCTLSACGSSSSSADSKSATTEQAADDTSADTEPATTAAPTTEAPTTEAPTTTAAPVTTMAVTETTAPIQYIDPTTLLQPVAGYDSVPAPESAASSLVATFSANADIVSFVQAIGGVSLLSQADQAETRVLFLGLYSAPDDATTKDFLTGVIGDGTDVRSGTVAGYTGVLYTDTDGSPSFATVRGSTGLLATGTTEDSLTAAITALFAANPDL